MGPKDDHADEVHRHLSEAMVCLADWIADKPANSDVELIELARLFTAAQRQLSAISLHRRQTAHL